MLKRMRDHFKVLSLTLWLVIGAFVGTTFLVWGVRSTSSGGGRGIVATVRGERISFEEYDRAYQQRYRMYQQLLGEKFDEQAAERLKIEVRDGLINKRLLLQEAKRMGLSVSPEELRVAIKAYPEFAQGGTFSRDQYLRVLRASGLTPDRFEENMRQNLLAQKVEDLVKGTAKVSPLEAWQAYQMANERVTVDYVIFSKEEGTKEAAEKLLVKIKEGHPFAKAAAAAGLKATRITFTFKDPLEIPDQTAFKAAASALKKGETSQLIQGQQAAYLLHLLDRQGPERSQFEKEKQAFSQALLVSKREQLFADWLRQVRAQAKLVIEQEGS